jgi:hypothetical protein
MMCAALSLVWLSKADVDCQLLVVPVILRIDHNSVSFESSRPFNAPDYSESYCYIFHNVTGNVDSFFLGNGSM